MNKNQNKYHSRIMKVASRKELVDGKSTYKDIHHCIRPIHITLCEKKIDYKWYVIELGTTGLESTCKECAEIKRRIFPTRKEKNKIDTIFYRLSKSLYEGRTGVRLYNKDKMREYTIKNSYNFLKLIPKRFIDSKQPFIKLGNEGNIIFEWIEKNNLLSLSITDKIDYLGVYEEENISGQMNYDIKFPTKFISFLLKLKNIQENSNKD